MVEPATIGEFFEELERHFHLSLSSFCSDRCAVHGVQTIPLIWELFAPGQEPERGYHEGPGEESNRLNLVQLHLNLRSRFDLSLDGPVGPPG